MNRRRVLTGAAATIGGIVAGGRAAWSAAPRNGRAIPPARGAGGGAPPTIFERFHAGLVHVHGELRDGATAIGAAIDDAARDAATRDAILAFTRELLDHHKSEDAFFFPAFRAAGRMRSADVAWLARKDEEHVAIHRTCVELRDATLAKLRGAEATRVWRRGVIDRIATLAALSRPHFAEEEATLTPAHVAELLREAELAAVYRDMGQNWHRR